MKGKKEYSPSWFVLNLPVILSVLFLICFIGGMIFFLKISYDSAMGRIGSGEFEATIHCGNIGIKNSECMVEYSTKYCYEVFTYWYSNCLYEINYYKETNQTPYWEE